MKVCKIMNKKKVIGYAINKSKIKLRDPIYKICRSESDDIKEGKCYYPHVCRKISFDTGLCITKDKVLVPIDCDISLDNDSFDLYLDSIACEKGVKYTQLMEVNEEEIKDILDGIRKE